MSKKFLIFVSSTFTDLKEERSKIFTAIMKGNHIPAGMEFFNAVDMEQMRYIKQVIDESDYYVLLLGARYGSLDEQGISYTEREFDYAVSKRLKIIPLFRRSWDKVEPEKTDKDKGKLQKLLAFRKRVETGGRLVGYWDTIDELITEFNSSLNQTIQLFPAVGWMRGDNLADIETQRKITELERENQRLREQLKSSTGIPIATDIKMEAVSVTNPSVFSEHEIECVSIKLAVTSGTIGYKFMHISEPYRPDDMVEFWAKAIYWFKKMVSICRFDLRITNPNGFMVENMDGDQHFFSEDGSEMQFIDFFQLDRIPLRPNSENYVGYSSPRRPNTNLNPNQSTMYTHHRLFIPDKEMSCTYQRIISVRNLLNPIEKKILIKYKILPLEMTAADICTVILDLEANKKLNDEGVFEFVANLLKKRSLTNNN